MQERPWFLVWTLMLACPKQLRRDIRLCSQTSEVGAAEGVVYVRFAVLHRDRDEIATHLCAQGSVGEGAEVAAPLRIVDLDRTALDLHHGNRSRLAHRFTSLTSITVAPGLDCSKIFRATVEPLA